MIALGRKARVALAAAVVVASVACRLSIRRDAWHSITSAFLNAGQALFAAWLFERWFGKTFELDNVQRVLGFLAATAIGSASPLHVWGLWFAAGSLGTVTAAPLLIGRGGAMRELPATSRADRRLGGAHRAHSAHCFSDLLA